MRSSQAYCSNISCQLMLSGCYRNHFPGFLMNDFIWKLTGQRRPVLYKMVVPRSLKLRTACPCQLGCSLPYLISIFPACLQPALIRLQQNKICQLLQFHLMVLNYFPCIWPQVSNWKKQHWFILEEVPWGEEETII